MADAVSTLRDAQARIAAFFEELVDVELFDEMSTQANALYKEQFAKKENPYGEPWTPRPGDDKRKSSPYFGKVMSVARDGFELRVAAPNADRSCVPFEPRGLGTWKPSLDGIVDRRARLLFRKVTP